MKPGHTITLIEADGQFQMQANGPDKLKLLGMLEAAKQMILNPPKEASPIVQAAAIPVLNGARR